jgi:quercetin dioxygenase-like cupin family protein
MSNLVSNESVAHLIDPHDVEILGVMGPTIQFIVPPDEAVPCIMRGTIPPGVSVPLHSHPEPETFISISGQVEGLVDSPEGLRWVPVEPGTIFHVPSGAKHAWRNRSDGPSVSIVVTTASLGRFFQEVGLPIAAGAPPPDPPSAEAMQHFLKTADRYGYWNATPEENARLGISLPAAA